MAEPEPRRAPALVAAFVAGSILWIAAAAWLTRDYFVDDAYITFRYVDNLWRGEGLVFNPPERVEGLTNLGWALALVPLAGLLAVPLAAKLAAIVLLVAIFWLLLLIGRELLDGETAIAAAAGLAALAHAELAYFTLAGMETGLAAFLGLLATRRLQTSPGSLTAVALLSVGLFLVRPELVLVFPLFLVFRGRREKLARGLGVFGGGLALVTIGRLVYFGQALPITGSAKSPDLGSIVSRALDSLTQANINLPTPFAGILGLAILAVGAFAWRRRQPDAASFAIATVATSVLFAIYAPADWTGLGRYFAPAVPLAMLLLVAGVREIALRLLTTRALQETVTLAAVLLLTAGHFHRTFHVLDPAELDRLPGYIMASHSLVEPSRWISEQVPPDATIASRRIGVLGFVTGRHVYDYMFGLTDPEVARLVGRHGHFDDPRAPVLAESWRRHAPDYLLEDASTLATWAGPRGDHSTVVVHGTPFREIRRFPIGDQVDWVLLEAVADPEPR